MKKTVSAVLLTMVMIFVFGASSHASQIIKITLAELQSKADLIALAKVMKIVEQGDTDQVTIKADSFLKGNSLQKDYTFTLVTRGGLKDFDPLLKVGDSGVFFLKRIKSDGRIEKAYWGSIATFQKNHFDLMDQKYSNGQDEP